MQNAHPSEQFTHPLKRGVLPGLLILCFYISQAFKYISHLKGGLLMTMDLQITDALPSTDLQQLEEKAKEFRGKALADSTYRAYRTSWNLFHAWCQTNGKVSLPAVPKTVELYITDLAMQGQQVSTINKKLAAISKIHQVTGHTSPTKSERVKGVWKGIQREIGLYQQGKEPLLIEDLRKMVSRQPDTPLGLRNRALLVIGFSAALRRSELANIEVPHVKFVREGLELFLPKRKTDQAKEGTVIGLPFGSNPLTCPVRTVQAWLEAAGHQDGPLFRSVDLHGNVGENKLSGNGIALIVKRCCEEIGLNPEKFGAHSLRSGFATSAAAAGKSEKAIMSQAGHRSTTTLHKYIKHATLFTDNAAVGIGL